MLADSSLKLNRVAPLKRSPFISTDEPLVIYISAIRSADIPQTDSQVVPFAMVYSATTESRNDSCVLLIARSD